MKIIIVVFLALAVVNAVPSLFPHSRLTPKVDALRSQYVREEGRYVSDMWVSREDLEAAARYDPVLMNTYHLFTRHNPTISQPLVYNDDNWLLATNYNSGRRTIVLIHGWLDNVTSAFNIILVSAFLEAEDVNIMVVDWSHGSGTVAYPIAVINTPVSGLAVANFISWLNSVGGSDLSSYHIVGHNLGAHQAGIIGRELLGQVAYITGLDPAFIGWLTNDDRFRSTDGTYTEVIHTNAGLLGFPSPLADSDFYPNGGIDMPGCSSQECDSNRSIHYFSESIRAGGFTGTRCFTFTAAMAGQCNLPGPLRMGGILPKTGQNGVFYLHTNAFAPYSRG